MGDSSSSTLRPLSAAIRASVLSGYSSLTGSFLLPTSVLVVPLLTWSLVGTRGMTRGMVESCLSVVASLSEVDFFSVLASTSELLLLLLLIPPDDLVSEISLEAYKFLSPLPKTLNTLFLTSSCRCWVMPILGSWAHRSGATYTGVQSEIAHSIRINVR